jgi:SWI/SNF-related matrix-associated actin-dependent regulator of chromatin subfamily A member 5
MWKDYIKQKSEGLTEISEDQIPEEYTIEDENTKFELISKGFTKWTKKEFLKFLRASEFYDINDFENISRFMKTKSPLEVEEYVTVFKQRIDELPNGQRISAKLNKFETEKNRHNEYSEILENLFKDLCDQYNDIYSNIKIPYKNKAKNNNILYG